MKTDDVADVSEALPLPETVQPGEILRQTRERRGLTLEEVATQLNLTVERVSQIEEQQWQLLPGLTFARGYLRLYARLFGMDADALVEQFNQLTGSLPEPLILPERLPIDAEQGRSFLSARLASLILLAVLVIGGFFWWERRTQADRQPQVGQELDWSLELEKNTDGSPESEPLAALLEAENPPASLSGDSSAEMAAPAENPVPALPGVSVGPTPAPANAPANASTTPAPASVPARTSTATQNTAPPPALEEGDDNTEEAAASQVREGLLNFAFSEDCWLQVKDGEGKVLFSGILGIVDTLELSGVLPIELRIGNPGAVVLHYNGEKVKLTSTTTRLKFDS